MEDKYLDDLNTELYFETQRCAMIRDIFLLEEKVRNHESSLLRYYYALKIVFLLKKVDIRISLDNPELWNQEIVGQLNESTRHIDEICEKIDLYTKRKKL